jgi:hypothetical protein
MPWLPADLTGHVDDIVHAACDPDVAISINAGAVTREIVALHTMNCLSHHASSKTTAILPLHNQLE